MSTTFTTLEAQALRLSPEDRAALADHLLASLAPATEVDDAWAAEVERRVAEIEAGRMPLGPVEESIARVRRALA